MKRAYFTSKAEVFMGVGVRTLVGSRLRSHGVFIHTRKTLGTSSEQWLIHLFAYAILLTSRLFQEPLNATKVIKDATHLMEVSTATLLDHAVYPEKCDSIRPTRL